MSLTLVGGPAGESPIPKIVEQGHAEPKPAPNSAKEPASQRRGTDESPLVVKIQSRPKTQAEAEQDPDYQQARAADRHFVIVGIVTIVVGVFQTAALVCTFAVMMFVAVRQLRAYVKPSVQKIVLFSLTEPIRIAVRFENTGQTPARHLATYSVVFVGVVPIEEEGSIMNEPKHDATNRRTPVTLFPGAATEATGSAEATLTTAQVNGLLNKEGSVYIAGGARYVDVFRRRRTSQFCYYIDQDSLIELIKSELGTCAPPTQVRFVAAPVFNHDT